MAHACHSGGHQDGWVHLPLTVGGRAEHYLPASCNLGGGGKHQHGGEEGSRSARNVEPHLFYGNALLPALHALAGLNLVAFKLLCLMKLGDIAVGQHDGGFQIVRHQTLGLFHLGLRYRKRMQLGMVKLLLIFPYGIVAMGFHLTQDGGNRGVQLGGVYLGTTNEVGPLFS